MTANAHAARTAKTFKTRNAPCSVSAAASGPTFSRLSILPQFYETLRDALGPMHWWPARTPFEVIVGAILTQNTAWGNVERAIANLHRERLLTPRALERVPLGTFVRFLRRDFGGSLARMFRTPTAELRERLLGVHGIGPETADSILLYAGSHRVFVVDAYTKRILLRHGLVSEKADYEEVRRLFESSLPQNPGLYNEFHALLVNVGKNWCRPREPRCEDCPLGPHLLSGSAPDPETRP